MKVYARLEYSSPASSKGWLTVYNGLAVNTGTMQIEGDPLCPDKSGSIRLHDKIYFTREMAQKTFVLHAVMYNAAERRVYTNVIHEGFIANGSTVMWGREMTAGILEVEFKEVTYTPDFSLTFEEVGKLASLEITQYDDNDNALETLAYSPDNFNEIPYVFVYDPDGERETPAYARLNRNTAYVIIKKTYEGEQFNPNSAPTEPTSERILLNNNFNGKIEIPLPMKGLVSRHEISFNFPVFDG